MAHAAVVSLLKTLDNLSRSQISSSPPYPDTQVESLKEKLSALRQSLERIFPVTRDIQDDVADLESNIREAVYKSQDAIESFHSSRVLSPQSAPVSGDLKKIIDSFDPVSVRAEELAKTAGSKSLGSEGTDEPISSRSASRSKTNRIIGQEEDFKRVTAELVSLTDELQTLPIIGMPGIGKTTLARSIYEDRRMQDEFLARAWVTVSAEYNFRDIFTKLLASIETRGQKGDDLVSNNKLGVSRESDEQLAQRLYQTLFDTRYLLVIDDMWNTNVWDRLKQYFPDNKNRSRIILTTRDKNIAAYVNPEFKHEMKPLSQENSWILLCYRIFDEGSCPPQLEPKGRKIAENCKGLPLSLTVIGGQLSQERKTVEYWDIIEKDINAATDAAEDGKEYIEILTLSYNHLPSRLKGCFLYMGGFPEDYDIILSKLIRLWVAEGFLKVSKDSKDSKVLKKDSKGEFILELVAKRFLEDLIDRNLVTIRKFGPDGQIKSCGVHDILRDIAVKKCKEELFFHGIKRYSEPVPEDAVTQRRLSVHKNILMCMEDVYNSAIRVKNARSFLFTGNHHHHPYPFSLDFEYLRVLDALTLYFIEFPDEVVKMIHLSYLSFTYNGKLPSSIVKLRNLQVLIVRQHPKIIFLGTSMLPDEIWNMPQLRHLSFTETELPNISGMKFLSKDSVLFENLQSLSNVNAESCKLEALKRFPNLKKLEMWVAKPGEVEFHIDKLEDLEVFKFTVLNPVPNSKVAFQPELAFPKKLRKLSLSGCGIPWDDMTILGQMEHLEVLKLREFAFHGSNDIVVVPEDEGEREEKVSVWRAESGEFSVLKYLLLEALDLACWDADDTHFPSLETLIIRHCYELEYIPEEFGDIGCLELIEMIDCNPSCVSSAREIRKKQLELNTKLQVRIYSSWE